MPTRHIATTYAVAVALCALGALAHAQSTESSAGSPPPATRAAPSMPKPERWKVPVPLTESSTQSATATNSGFANVSALRAVSATMSPVSSSLSPPITINYSGNASALLIDATGTGKGAEVHINNPHNTASALYGITNGSGAGLTGYNQGTVGPAGKFGILNANSTQPAVYATTNGSGPAFMGVVTMPYSAAPALLGLNTDTDNFGTGVEGQGSYYGMLAYGGYYGIYASGSKVGVYGESLNGDGAAGHAFGGGNGLSGYSDTGYGVYGVSGSGYAGYFAGTVAADSYTSTSDRNAKTHIKLIDGPSILARIDHLPVSSWVFKKDILKSHVGPMAQDFHAAFHLSGEDDKHINLTDITGVSLAAIQELSKEMKRKDAEIAALEVQLRSVTDKFSDVSTRVALLEQQRNLAVTTVNLTTELGRDVSTQ